MNSSNVSNLARTPESRGPAALTHAQLAALIAMASFAMLFGTLLLSYLFSRARQGVWPPVGVEPLDTKISTLSSLAIVLSSLFLHFAMSAFNKALNKEFLKMWALGTTLGCVFVLLQARFVLDLWESGLRVQDGLFQSMSYTLVIVHVLHVIIAALPLFVVLVLARRPSYCESQTELPLLTSWFWHFLGGVWLITYFLMFWY